VCFERLAVLSSAWQKEFENNDCVKEQKWSISSVIRFDDPDRWWTQVQRHWRGPLSRMLEQVSLLYFIIFDLFALCCGFGGSGSAGWSDCHVWCSDCVGDSDFSSGASSFTPRDWCHSFRSLPVWPGQPLWFLDGWNASPGKWTPNEVIYIYT